MSISPQLEQQAKLNNLDNSHHLIQQIKVSYHKSIKALAKEME